MIRVPCPGGSGAWTGWEALASSVSDFTGAGVGVASGACTSGGAAALEILEILMDNILLATPDSGGG
ncbi:MAG: hypothetical protein NVSMB26_29670 [Beijerinckiaceae bacterium]